MTEKDPGMADIKIALQVAALTTHGEEFEVRQLIRAFAKDKRLEGASYRQIAETFGKGGINIQRDQVRSALADLVIESLWELIQSADNLDAAKCEKCRGRDQPAPARQTKKTPEEEAALRRQFAVPTGDQRLKCGPLRPEVREFERRDGVPDFVYEEGELEHPAIPGLMLSRAERVYGAYLDIVDGAGETRKESTQERPFRIKWKRPIPMTHGSTDGQFVNLDLSLFDQSR